MLMSFFLYQVCIWVSPDFWRAFRDFWVKSNPCLHQNPNWFPWQRRASAVPAVITWTVTVSAAVSRCRCLIHYSADGDIWSVIVCLHLCFSQSFVPLGVSPGRGRVFCVLREPIRTKRGGTSATGVPEAPHRPVHHLSINVSRRCEYEPEQMKWTTGVKWVCVFVSGVTECQRRGLRCSERGDFLSAQPDFLSGRWRCFNSEGVELEWTNSDKPLTDDECSGDVSAANQRAD